MRAYRFKIMHPAHDIGEQFGNGEYFDFAALLVREPRHFNKRADPEANDVDNNLRLVGDPNKQGKTIVHHLINITKDFHQLPITVLSGLQSRCLQSL